ncbi:MAG: hypothetical protein GX199_01345 [Firmicutes bacterium]|nr:hypothetical protein [Bacillota bacterium]
METNDLIAQLGDNAKAVLQKALQCAKRDDLLKLAAEHGITLSERQVDELLSYSQPGVEPLSDSELDAITGGSDKPRCRRCRTNKHVYWLNGWVCRRCGDYFHKGQTTRPY